jgi:hypothetical protein
MSDDTNSMSGTDYEKLTHLLVDRIARRSPVATTRLEHNVVLPGKASAHQIDVLWEFTAASGHPHRIIFECRRKSRNLEQNDALAFKGVVDEVAFESIPTTGVMVHVKGFQIGAKRVAETYGVIILELRTPNDKDVKGRATAIRVSMVARVSVVRDLDIQATELLSDALQGPVLNLGLEVEKPNGQRVGVLELLQAGEIDLSSSELTPPHRVDRIFEPPVILTVEGKPAARVGRISATVGEEQGDPFEFTVGGRERLAWMVKDTLSGDSAWFTMDGSMYLNES